MTGETPQLLTLQETAEQLGVHYMTVYRYIRTGRLEAQRRSGRWLVDTADVQRFGEPSPLHRGSTNGDTRNQALIVGPPERLLARLMAGDGPGSWAVVEESLLGRSPTEVYLDVVAPALRRLGQDWADGRIRIGEEHRATASALRLVGRLSPLFARPGRRRATTVILAGAPGDRHVIPVTMVGDVLRADGFDVVDLGADVPCDSLLESIAALGDLLAVGLSVSTDSTLAAARSTVMALHHAYPSLPVLVGGPAVTGRTIADSLGADHWACDAADAARLLRELAARPRVRTP